MTDPQEVFTDLATEGDDIDADERARRRGSADLRRTSVCWSEGVSR
ncbi:MAG: hypothetical protein ABW156_00430 [Jiangellaceae bacterium]